MTNDTLISYEQDEDIVVLTLNRPRALNAFSAELLHGLCDAVDRAACDRRVRALVLTGAGRAFSAGGDLSQLRGADDDAIAPAFHRLAGKFHQAVIEIATMDKPVIAAVNGAAAGGGFSLALACDLRILARSAFLQQAYTAAGLAVDGGGTHRLPRLIGLARALELVFLDERLSAEEALAWGLATQVVDDEALLPTAVGLAKRLAKGPVQAYGRIKRLLARSFDNSLEAQLEDERRAITGAGSSPEGIEGMTAFLEKRAPDFVKAGT